MDAEKMGEWQYRCLSSQARQSGNGWYWDIEAFYGLGGPLCITFAVTVRK